MNKSNKTTGDLLSHTSFRWLEGFLLVIVLSISAVRLCFIEMPQNTMQNAMLSTTPRGISLLLSGVIFIAAMAGWMLQLLRGEWKPDKVMMGGWILFALGAMISTWYAASDKRAAMTEGFTLAVPMLIALVLCRWLDSPRRVSVVLWVILSMGCASVYASFEQAFEGNQKMVEDYRQNPGRHLQALGIEPNSLAHFQYEHRLHSKDIRGFLTTSNSTGTFLLAGIFIAAGLLADTIRHRGRDAGFAARLLVVVLVLLILLAGLWIGKSRGALAGGMLGVFLFFILLRWGRQLLRYRRLVLSICLLAFIGIWVVTIAYGIKHDRLPGPNAMYVRWQYWVGAAQMAAEHPLGVGGGNFGTFYTHYKIPAAPETIRDPHHVILSILCQFGIPGLLGFIMMIFAALGRGLKKVSGDLQPTNLPDKPHKMMALGVLGCTTAALLWIRPFVSEGGILGETVMVRQSVFVVMYLIPAFFFACPYVFLWITDSGNSSDMRRQGLGCGLICGVAAILTHNLIDFALFEPGVWMTFWLLVAMIFAPETSCRLPMAGSKYTRILWPAGLIAAAAIVLYVYVWMPLRAGVQFQEGLRHYNEPKAYFQQAAKIDPLDPDPWVYLSRWSESDYLRSNQPHCLMESLTLLGQAQKRDPYNFIYNESLSEIYIYLSEAQKENNEKHLETAYQVLIKAQQLYPGSDRIAYNLGILAEKLNQPQKAAEHFCRVVEIEDQYRGQFKQMYPDYPLCSRLGQARYDHAKNYILKLNSTE